MSKEEKLMYHLGIVSTGVQRGDMPDYLTIALQWYEHYESSPNNQSISNYHYYIGLAEEFGFCVRTDDHTIPQRGKNFTSGLEEPLSAFC